MADIVYPFDPTGQVSSNYIIEEQHIVTESNYRDYFFIVPNFAPFFTNRLIVKHHNLNEVRTLVEGSDYHLALNYLGATRSIGQPIYGAISLNTLINIGVISISYQTLGGPWCANIPYVLEVLLEKQYNPRLIAWEQVTNVQETFPPINHDQDFETLAGYEELIAAIVNLSETVANSESQAPTVRHLVDKNNPHSVTLQQLGYSIASLTQAKTGTSKTTLITPYLLSETITDRLLILNTKTSDLETNVAGSLQTISDHLQDFNNPHRINKGHVGLNNVPNLSLATDTEIANRTAVDKFITLRQVLDLISSFNFDGSSSENLKYNINPATTVVEEGSSVLFYVGTVDIPNNTVLYWSVNNITTSDTDFQQTNGTITIQNNSANFTINVKSDVLAESNEMFGIRLRKDSASGPIVAMSPTVLVINKMT